MVEAARDGALAGVRVVEVGDFIAAPYAARCLGDLGADVIKVEPPGGDSSRRHGPFLDDVPDPEASGLYCLLNTNKRGIVLDVDDATGRDRLDSLLARADVLVENVGLDIGAPGARHPRLVHVSLSCFGRHGPWRDFRGHALHASAAGGGCAVIGEPGRPPLPLPLSQPDYAAGINGAAGALLGLLARRRTGEGQRVDVAATDVVAFYGGITSPLYTAAGLPWARSGHRASGSGGFYPYTILPTSDGALCMITRSGHPWRRFLDALGNPPWSADPRYRDRAAMGREYPDEVDALLVPYLRRHTSAELQAICRERAIPFAAVRDAGEVAACPQLGARDFWVTIGRERTGTLTYPGAPWKLSRTPWRCLRPAPLLGEHTATALSDLA